MSVEIPDPQKLRVEAKKVQAAQRRASQREARAAAKAKAERIAKLQEGQLDALIVKAVDQVKRDNKKGLTHTKVYLATAERWKKQEFFEAMEPIWEKLVKHFEPKYTTVSLLLDWSGE